MPANLSRRGDSEEVIGTRGKTYVDRTLDIEDSAETDKLLGKRLRKGAAAISPEARRQAGRPNEKTLKMKLFAFFFLVAIQGAHLLFFRLSQTGGKYTYNTASAIAITEAFKFVISAGFYYMDTERALPPLGLVLAYTALAAAYAIANQLSMLLLTKIGMGVFSLGKSLTPSLTALTLWALYEDEVFHRYQAMSFAVITVGLFLIFGKAGSGITFVAVSLLIVAVYISTFTSVYNYRILNKGRSSLHMQNMCLYSQGFIFNLVLYFAGITASGAGKGKNIGFFSGYDNGWVIGVLIMQSFMGLAISAVYKYGDAIIKCLAVAVQSAILLCLDVTIFGIKFTYWQLIGAAVVMLGTYAYFKYALPAAKAEKDLRHGVDPVQTPFVRTMRWVTIGVLLATFIGACITSAVIFG